jgi:cobalt transporter subunit CbtA
MLKRLLAGGLFAGLSAGALAACLQLIFVVPLLQQGELYEAGALVHQPAPAGDHDHVPPDPDDRAAPTDHDHPEATAAHDHPEAVAVAFDPRRAAMTFGTMLVTWTGFALVLVAGFAVAATRGIAVTGRTGLLWGLAGFAAVQLAPAAGLAPELPGSAAAAFQARQIWWAFTVISTGAGIAALAFGRGIALAAPGIVLIALPQLVGAPAAPFAGVAPPELSALFATRVLAAGAVSWALLGLIAGAVWQRGG